MDSEWGIVKRVAVTSYPAGILQQGLSLCRTKTQHNTSQYIPIHQHTINQTLHRQTANQILTNTSLPEMFSMSMFSMNSLIW